MKHTCQSITRQSLARFSCDALIIGLYTDTAFSPEAKWVDALSKKALTRALKYGDCSGQIGQSLLLYDLPGLSCKRILVMGCGEQKPLLASELQTIFQTTAAALKPLNVDKVACLLTDLKVEQQTALWAFRHSVLSLEQTFHSPLSSLKKQPSNKQKQCTRWHWLQQKTVSIPAYKKAIKEAQSMAQGAYLCKQLGDLPANICTPHYLAQCARKLANQHPKLTAKVLNQAQMERLGMGALLAVGQGSRQPPKLIELHYRGTVRNSAPIVLVGKGITFDTGGISLKPRPGMDEMKFDMLGAATVIGTLQAIAELKLPIHVIGLVAAAENMPDGAAIKPGDVVKSLSGKTIEILNTDAEGRLVLCDAITYCQRFNPKAVIDIATLTGAAIVALGKEIGALMGNNDALCDALKAASQQVDEPFWRLPLPASYYKKLDSNFADLANIGSGGEAGSILAGCFLAQFAEKLKWAHLDIAGIAWLSGKNKGASGRPVAMLVQYLLDQV